MAIDISKYGKKRVIGQQSVYVDKEVYKAFAAFCRDRFSGKIGEILTDVLEDFMKSQMEGPGGQGADAPLPPAVRNLLPDLLRLNAEDLASVAASVGNFAKQAQESKAKTRKIKS